MAYDKDLAQRIRKVLADEPGLTEKNMFGGVGFLLRGNMVCGVLEDALIARVGAAQYKEALAMPHVRVLDKNGRPMTGWVQVGRAGVASAADLRRWVMLGVEQVRAMPSK